MLGLKVTEIFVLSVASNFIMVMLSNGNFVLCGGEKCLLALANQLPTFPVLIRL